MCVIEYFPGVAIDDELVAVKWQGRAKVSQGKLLRHRRPDADEQLGTVLAHGVGNGREPVLFAPFHQIGFVFKAGIADRLLGPCTQAAARLGVEITFEIPFLPGHPRRMKPRKPFKLINRLSFDCRKQFESIPVKRVDHLLVDRIVSFPRADSTSWPIFAASPCSMPNSQIDGEAGLPTSPPSPPSNGSMAQASHSSRAVGDLDCTRSARARR